MDWRIKKDLLRIIKDSQKVEKTKAMKFHKNFIAFVDMINDRQDPDGTTLPPVTWEEYQELKFLIFE